jgi:hypothetical protein
VQRKQAGSVIARHHHAFGGGENEVAFVDRRVIGTVSENAFLIIEQKQRFREKTAVEGGRPVVTGHSFSCASRMVALDSRSFSRRCVLTRSYGIRGAQCPQISTTFSAIFCSASSNKPALTCRLSSLGYYMDTGTRDL